MIPTFEYGVGLTPVIAFPLVILYCAWCCLSWCVCQPSKTSNDGKSTYRMNVGTAILIVAYVLSPLVTDEDGLHDLVRGTDPLLDEILERVPSITSGPSPPLLLRNAHLQFVPWMIQNEIHRRGGIEFQRIDFEVTACVDKSRGPDHCEHSPMMNDTVTLDIFPPLQDVESDYNANFNRSSPIIIFAPGLRCHSQDMPGNMIIRRAYGAGFRSIVVNRRGHTPGRTLTAPRWNLFGDVEDMEQVYWHVRRELADPNTPLFLHGISSGTAVVVSGLSAWDGRRARGEEAPSFVASISVTPGYDTSKVMRPERFKFPYNHVLNPMVKDHFVLRNEEVLRAFDSDAVDATLRASTLQEFVDAAAPFAGYPNASEYYRRENPVNDLGLITTPELVLNSFDDPCCDISNLYERSPYEGHGGRTFAEQVTESRWGMIAVTRTGSHCPFLDGTVFPFVRDPLGGGWMLNSWADRVSIDYYRAALEVYGDRRFL